jgi:excisionase family DNA binding protein
VEEIMKQNEPLLTVKDVAERFGVTVPTVRRWIKDGRIQGRMPGGQKAGYRIPASEVERLLRGTHP